MRHQSPSYSVTMRLRYPDVSGQLGRITSAIGEVDGLIGAVDIVEIARDVITRDITVNARDGAHAHQIVERVRLLEGVTVARVSDRTFLLHLGGKIEIKSKVPIRTRDDLSMVYTPGVARVCQAIHSDPEAAFALTIRRNTVAVVTDGSAVLGLGNLGPAAALPVMEGKAMLFKEFAGVDAFPICLDTQDSEKIVETCVQLAPTFGGINLEDISSPRCIEIEQQLTERLDVPVFHDDQHGTAIVVLAALQNALRVVGKRLDDLRVVINGAGAAGIAIARLLGAVGVEPIVLCDRLGAIYRGRDAHMNFAKRQIADQTNPESITGSLSKAIVGADVFVGVSVGDVLKVDDLRRMAKNPVVFALANPDPEIDPDLAVSEAAVVASGRSDYANQINNVLCFPGLFRGLLDVRAKRVTDAAKIAAARAIAGVIADDKIRPDYIVPSVFDRRVSKAVAKAVSAALMEGETADRRQNRSD
ncbi:MAG: malate dehydrogenase [Planctomycetes bacterium RBG_13_63_9]|nr:MAG: malate dehydrogenase [Planctomycetes bacterium RBG_13_63_9]